MQGGTAVVEVRTRRLHLDPTHVQRQLATRSAVPVTTPHDLKNEGSDRAPAPMTQLVRFIAASLHDNEVASSPPPPPPKPPPPPPVAFLAPPPPTPSFQSPDRRGVRCFSELRLLIPTVLTTGGLWEA